MWAQQQGSGMASLCPYTGAAYIPKITRVCHRLCLIRSMQCCHNLAILAALQAHSYY